MMRSRMLLALVARAGALTSSPALARDICDRNARVCVTVSESWQSSTVNGALVIVEPGRSMVLELRAVRLDFERELEGRFADLEWRGPATPAQQSSMAGLVRTGQGRFRDGNREPIPFFMLGLGHAQGGVVGLGIVTERG